MSDPLHLAFVLGTRPEAIKLAPVIAAGRARPDMFRCSIIVSGQHQQMAQTALEPFGLTPDVDLRVMQANQQPTEVLARILVALPPVLSSVRPAAVVVQGDTTTTLAAGLAAYHQQIPVAHVEAGLRTANPYSPFPEEMNRRLTSSLATLHFAPTVTAKNRLLAEGVHPGSVSLTGNTVVDALRVLAPRATRPARLPSEADRRMILVTSHRRENHGAPLDAICLAVRDIAATHRDVNIVWPVHPHPNVSVRVRQALGGIARVHLLDPVDYPALLWLLQAATFVLTDSGGLQEEAATLRKPVLVMRLETERSEGICAGVARLVGTNRATISAEADRLLDDPHAYEAMTAAVNPYGDGHAAGRVLEGIRRYFATRTQRTLQVAHA